MYLTRDEAVAELVADGSTQVAANALLDGALSSYPQSVRTNFDMITGYRKGTIMDAYYVGNPGIPADLFTISRW